MDVSLTFTTTTLAERRVTLELPLNPNESANDENDTQIMAARLAP
jgi:hypothetical protein